MALADRDRVFNPNPTPVWVRGGRDDGVRYTLKKVSTDTYVASALLPDEKSSLHFVCEPINSHGK